MIEQKGERSDLVEILVVDDNPTSLQLILEVLRKAGYRVRLSVNGTHALLSVAAKQPDLILLDVKMADIDGYEVCRRLKSDKKSRDIPVIFISGLGETTQRIEGFNAGGVDYITKPFETEEVLARVNTHLRLRELTERLEQKVNGRTVELTNANRRLHQEINERKKAEKELLESNKQLQVAKEQAELANRVKTRFLTNMTHELRTPLNAILGYAHILNLDTTIKENLKTGIHIIKESGENLLSRISDIIEMSNIEDKEIELKLTPVNMSMFISVIADVISTRAELKGLQFIFEPAQNLPTGIIADELRLRQLLFHLLDNAIRFTNKGQIVFRVTVLSYQKKDIDKGKQDRYTIRFEVRDTGIGIPSVRLEKIFIPFEQVLETPIGEGAAGLGLSICRQLAHLMGGEIHIESEVGHGSTFWVDLTFPATEMEIPGFPEEVEQIIPPPYEELELLHDLVQRGDMNQLTKKAKCIEALGNEYIPFARKLEKLAEGFQEKAIKVLVEKYWKRAA